MPKYFQTYYYSFYGCTMLFCCICAGIAVCIGYLNRSRFAALKFFYIYPLASLMQIAIAVFLPFFIRVKTYNHVNIAAANIFLVIELILIFDYFKKILQSKNIQFIIHIITAIYFLVIFIEWFVLGNFNKFPVHLFTLQAICILVPGFYYLFDIFKGHTIPNLLKEFSFWVSIGTVFYFSCTIPLFLLKDFAYKANGGIIETNVYSINFICYGVMFLFIAKAYVCPKKGAPIIKHN